MGGLGTSSGTSSSDSPWAGPLGSFGKFETKLARPLLNTLGSQYLEALRTGGVNSFIPWITRAVDASRSAGSASTQQLQDQLARSRFAGTSAGAGILGSQEMSANQQTAQTPSDIIMSFLQGAPGFALGVGGQGANALAGAGSLQHSTATTSTPSFWDQFNQGLQTGGTYFGGSAAPVPNYAPQGP